MTGGEPRAGETVGVSPAGTSSDVVVHPASFAESALSDAAIVALVGPEAFHRALLAVRAGHVSGVQADDRTRTVTGRVRGTHRDDYAVTVFLSDSAGGTTVLRRSRCTCPVALDCKHAAAVLLVARHQQPDASRVQRSEWERVLGRLVERRPERPAGQGVLALGLGVERIPSSGSYPGRLDLRVRPLRRGKSGGWVRSGIGWDDLDFVARSYVAAQRDLLLQVRAAAGQSARYSLPRTPWLSLASVSSAWWSLLDQAAPAGLELVTSAPLSGPYRSAGDATVTLDLGRVAGGGLSITPRVLVGGLAGAPGAVGVLGDPAHGVFHLDDDQLSLARLDTLLPPDLRALLLGRRPLLVPAVDEGRFFRDFIPALRRHVSVVSTDHSVTVPPPMPPRLELAVVARPERRLRLDWSFAYGPDDACERYLLDGAADDARRDPEAEAKLLGALQLPAADLPALVREGANGRIEPTPHALLDAPAALIFVQRVLPALRAQQVDLLLGDDVSDFRESVAEVAVSVTATPRPRSPDWFDLHVVVEVEGESVPLDRLLVALTHDEEHLVLDTGVFLTLKRPIFATLRGLIEEARALNDPDTDELRVNRFQVSAWQELLDSGVVGRQASQWRRTVRALSATTAPRAVPPPTGLSAQLRPYQLTGLSWLCALYDGGLGGVLADDMGLGKTLQTLALVARVRGPAATPPLGEGGEGSPKPPFLVVAPTSVVTNWAVESARFTPSLRVVQLGGKPAGRRAAAAEEVAGVDVVITSYALLRLREAELAALPWAGLVLDEAQFVKNHRSRTHRAARAINAPFKLAITGTPLENSLMDLWSLLSITAPGLFPSPQQFSRYYGRPIERDGDQTRLEQLRRRIRPFVLRRSKDSVASELPAKQEQVLHVELSPRHRRVYATHLQRERQKVLGLIDALDEHRFSVLSSLTLLRRLSLDPVLVDEAYAGIPAAKVELLVDHLSELSAEGHRGLVFSQFTSFLGRIRRRLEEAGIGYAYLDGATTRRDAAVEHFRSGRAPVFLISLKAGGFGLNLTEADYCFLLDPWWNPASEAQAVDRAHRIGQTRHVLVYRMVARGTIEEKVMALKARKAALAGSVLTEAALDGSTLTAEEIRELLAA